MRGHVLAVDDSESDLLTLSFVLKKVGYQVSTAKDGYDALDFLVNKKGTDPINLIVLDLQMPTLSGLATLKKIQEMKELKSIPIMVVSGKNDKETIKACIESGAKDYMIKPIDPDIFQKKVVQLVTDQRSDWAEVTLPVSELNNGYFHSPGKLISMNEVTLTFLSSFPLAIKTNTVVNAPLLVEAGIDACPVRVLDCKKFDSGYLIQFELVGLDRGKMKALRLLCRRLYSESKAA